MKSITGLAKGRINIHAGSAFLLALRKMDDGCG
jgi:hypothetical protein